MEKAIANLVLPPTLAPPREPIKETEFLAYLSDEAPILIDFVERFGRAYGLSAYLIELATEKALAALGRNPPKPGYAPLQWRKYIEKIAESKIIDEWRKSTRRYWQFMDLIRDRTLTVRQGTGYFGVTKYRDPFAGLPLLPGHRDEERIAACEQILDELGMCPGQAGWLLNEIVLNNKRVVDVANELGLPPARIRKRLQKAREKAKKLYPRICAQRRENWGNLRHQIETMFAVRQSVQGYRRWLYRGKEHLPWPDKRQRAMPVLRKLRRQPRRPLVSRHWDQSVDAALEDPQVDNAPRENDYDGDGELPVRMSETRSIIKSEEHGTGIQG